MSLGRSDSIKEQQIVGREARNYYRRPGRPDDTGLQESGHKDPEVGGTWVPVPGWPAQSGASASPTETPQLSDTAADPHRNPTDETAHFGTLVIAC